MQISLEQVLSTIDTTKNTVTAVKTVCKNHEKYTKHIKNESLKRNVKTTAETMLSYIGTCEQFVDDTVDQVKKRFDKLQKDIFGVNQTYGKWLDEFNQWLGIPDLEQQRVNERLSAFAQEFPNSSQYYQGSLTDRINLYIQAISRKMEELIQKLYDTVQIWVEEQIQKLKEFIDPYLKQLKDFGNELIGYVDNWLGEIANMKIFSDVKDVLKTGYDMAQDIIKELGLNPPQFDSIPDIFGTGNSTDVKLKIDDAKTFTEGLFSGQPDPRSAQFTAKPGSGALETDKGGAPLFETPKSAYNTKYTKQFPTVTPGGHVEDKDDTPGSERYYRAHPTGTFTEEQPDGSKVNKIVGNKFEIIEKNGNVEIKGDCNIIIGGNATINVAGNQNIVTGRDSIQMVKGNALQTVLGNLDQKVNGNVNQYIVGNVKQKISGNVDQGITGSVNQKIDGSSWQYIKGSSEQVIDGNSKQYIKGNSEQFIDGTCSQQIKGTLTQKVQGDVTQTLSANVNAKVGGNFDLNISGSFNVKSQQCTMTSSGETTIKGSRISLN